MGTDITDKNRFGMMVWKKMKPKAFAQFNMVLKNFFPARRQPELPFCLQPPIVQDRARFTVDLVI